MVLALSHDVRQRLDALERAEGTPALEIAHTAVSVFSQLDRDQRQILGQTAMGMVMDRYLRSRE